MFCKPLKLISHLPQPYSKKKQGQTLSKNANYAVIPSSVKSLTMESISTCHFSSSMVGLSLWLVYILLLLYLWTNCAVGSWNAWGHVDNTSKRQPVWAIPRFCGSQRSFHSTSSNSYWTYHLHKWHLVLCICIWYRHGLCHQWEHFDIPIIQQHPQPTISPISTSVIPCL